jgi:hypothetical protein
VTLDPMAPSPLGDVEVSVSGGQRVVLRVLLLMFGAGAAWLLCALLNSPTASAATVTVPPLNAVVNIVNTTVSRPVEAALLPAVTSPVVSSPLSKNSVVSSPIVSSPVVTSPVVTSPVVTSPVVTSPPAGVAVGTARGVVAATVTRVLRTTNPVPSTAQRTVIGTVDAVVNPVLSTVVNTVTGTVSAVVNPVLESVVGTVETVLTPAPNHVVNAAGPLPAPAQVLVPQEFGMDLVSVQVNAVSATRAGLAGRQATTHQAVDRACCSSRALTALAAPNGLTALGGPAAPESPVAPPVAGLPTTWPSVGGNSGPGGQLGSVPAELPTPGFAACGSFPAGNELAVPRIVSDDPSFSPD